jgi:endogenous inhibitor of DNA gyrase (YacG/DUF329 family)
MTDTTTTPPTGAATSSCPVSCPVCGQTFTPTPRQIPRRRYCSDRCRKTAWRHRHPGHRSRPGDVSPAVPRPGDVSPAVPRPGDVSPAVPRPGEILHASPARAEPAARCPHCARPVAVIALLVVPAAAQVPAPEVRDG